MKGEKMSVVTGIGIGFAERWAHEPAYPAKTLKIFLCALCDLWCKKMGNEKLNGISQNIIGAAIAVHRVLGPGLLESAYEACLVHELIERGMTVERQKSLPVIYKGTKIECGYCIDLLVEEAVIVELKALDKLMPIHSAQLVSYLKLSGCKLGLLINFNVTLLKTGIIRLINGIDDGFTPEHTENTERDRNAE